MRKFASVPPRIWLGELKAIRGNLEALAVHYHLTTSNHANMLGLYYVPVTYIAHETGSPLEGASKGLQSLVEAGICSYDDEHELVWVHEMAADQIAPKLSPKDNRVRSISDQLAMLPICPITLGFYTRYREAYHLSEERNLTPFEEAYCDKTGSPFEAPSEPLRSKEKEKKKDKDLGEGKEKTGLGEKGVSKGTYTREGQHMFEAYPTPASPKEGVEFLKSKGVPQKRRDEFLQLLIGGNLTPYDLEGVLEEERNVA